MEPLYEIYHPQLPPLLAELTDTPVLRRLAEVGMNCGCEYTAFPRFAGGAAYSRLEHSLGVGLIVWHFTEDAAQAAAGLLHDAATPTFAHVVDFLRGDYLRQEATEDGTRACIESCPALQAALKHRGLSTDDVSDYHRYPVADNDSPRLSADRLEYTLGNALRWGLLRRAEIAAVYGDLRVAPAEDGATELVFRSPGPALRFAEAALACSAVYISDEDRCAMQRLSELLRRALQAGVLTWQDLEGTEPALIEKLCRSPLAPDWQAFRSLRRTLRSDAPPDGRPWRQIPAKKRYIDPLVLGQGRVSALAPAFAAELAQFLAQPQTEWLLCE